MKPNHHSLAYKMQVKPNRTYKDLKQKQKAKISDWMFQATCEYYKEHGILPEGEPAEAITVKIYEKIKSQAIWVPYDEVHRVFLSKLPHYELRIIKGGLPEEKTSQPLQQKKSSTQKEKGNSNKICPECGRKMKQQFIGLQHCKCGMSWQKGIGFFERTSDMVFALERRMVGKKVKQYPVIRHRDS